MRVTPIAILSVALLASTAFQADARTRCERALDRVASVMQAFTKQYPQKLYPRTLKEFQQFAISRGKPLDLAPFSEFTYSRSAKEYSILYTCRDTGLGGVLGGARIPATY